MSSVNRGGSLTPAQIGLLVLVRICYSEYRRICMHANMQPWIYRGTCMCTCIRTCASCSRNQAEHCLFIPSCDKLSNADMTTEMISRGIEQAIRLHQATVLCYRTMQPRKHICVQVRSPHKPTTTTNTPSAAKAVPTAPTPSPIEPAIRALTTSTTRPRRNDDRREERRYDNRDHRHDDKSESLRTGQLHLCRPDFYPKISTLLIFIFNIIFTTFLHKRPRHDYSSNNVCPCIPS